MSHATVRGQRFYFEDSGGAGPALVFCHGNLMDHRMWAAQVAAFAPDFRCVTWDFRLHGQTEDDGRPFSYWDAAEDLLGLLDHLGIDRAVLVGHSQGGFTALRAALHAPDRVAGLVLIDTTGLAWPEPALAQMGAVADGFRAGGPAAVAPVLLDLLLGQPELYPAWRAAWDAQPRERLADAVRVLMGVDDLSDRLGEITAPALVLHGALDQPVPLPMGQHLSTALPNSAVLVVLPRAGHTPPLTDPEQVNTSLRTFLATQPVG